MGSKVAARETMSAAGVPDHPRDDRARRSRPTKSCVSATSSGWPIAIKASAGGGGKGLKVVRLSRRSRPGIRGGSSRRAGVLLGRGRLRRALSRGSEARRGAGARGRARQRHPSRGARLHDPAPSPEARRGDALAGGRRRARERNRPDRGRGCPRRRLSLRGHDRGPPLDRGRVLLPRDEHPHPGRAHGDRARHGARPRP